MILLIGGKGQGKLAYALQKTGAAPQDVATAPMDAGSKPILTGLETWLKGESDPMPALQALLKRNPEVVILCDEVGCGVVPMEKKERDWRERVGRTCCALAEQAERVERLFCGIPTVLKGDGPWN